MANNRTEILSFTLTGEPDKAYLKNLETYCCFDSKKNAQKEVKVTKEPDLESHLEFMTSIFKLNFKSTFSAIYHIPLKKTQAKIQKSIQEYYATDSKISGTFDMFICYSNKHALDESEGNDIVIAITFSGDKIPSIDKIKNSIDKNSDNLCKLIEEIFTECLDKKIDLAKMKEESSKFGYSSFGKDAYNKGGKNLDEKIQSLLGAFFHYGWVVLLRSEREQVTLPIKESEVLIFSDNIIKQQIRLINVKRRFLSHDRSNNDSIKKLCDYLREKYKINERYEQQYNLHKLFESYVDTNSKIKQLRRILGFSSVLLFLTVLGVTAGLAGLTGLVLSPNNYIFKDWVSALASGNAFASDLITLGIAGIYPILGIIAILLSSFLFSRMKRRKYNKSSK